MTTKEERIKTRNLSLEWWNGLDFLEQCVFCEEYYENFFKLTGKTYDQIPKGYITMIFLQEFYQTIKNLGHE